MGNGARYQLQKCLGRGGYGEVYLAHRTSPEGVEQRVAIKVLRGDLPSTDLALARLKDEARMLAVLDHPAIVRVLELTRLAKQVALVTDYVDGVDLSRMCTPALRLPPKVVVSALSEVAGALDCAHSSPSPETGKPLRLVHRDVKPENVRLSRHGESKLLDFGIARTPELAREAHTSAGNLPFTPGYTAPEAFVSLKQEPPTDVFALGATLFRTLVAERFYEGVRLPEQAALSCAPQKYVAYLDGRLHRLGDLDPALVALIRACLSYAPVERPTARELQGRLEAVAERLPGLTARRWVRENPLPEERSYEGALVGKVLVEEDGDSVTFDAPAVAKPMARPKRVPASNAPTELLPGPSTPRPVVRTVVRPMPWLMVSMGFLLLGAFALVLALVAFVTGWWMGH